MALSEFELALIDVKMTEFIEKRRPPVEARDQVDLSFKVEKQSVIIFEIRSDFLDPQKKAEIPIAKTTYTTSSSVWKIYCQRSDLKWHCYDPEPEVGTLDKFIQVVDEDETSIFWG
jgi:hypothetical protein